MKSPKKLKRGRPSLGPMARVRVSFTLSPEAVDTLREMTRGLGQSASEIVDTLILKRAGGLSLAKRRIPLHRIGKILEKRGVERAWLFGSVLRKDFGPKSDVDILVRYRPGADGTLLDFVDTKLELEAALGRPVDLVEEEMLENPFRRREILATREEVYAL